MNNSVHGCCNTFKKNSMKNISFLEENITPPTIRKKKIREGINFLIENEEKHPGEISVIFCSDNFLLKINEQYLSHDYYTDIITFDYVENSVISGDLFISLERVEENARQLDLSFEEELNRVILHGVLHLVGYNDKTEIQKKEMKEKEDFYLQKLIERV